jgi:hypothetical protein
MTFLLNQLILFILLVFPAPLSHAQTIASVLTELRRLGCSAANCTGPLRCGAANALVSTDFGSVICVPNATENLLALHLDGKLVALQGADNALVMPGGSSLKNMTVTDQPHLVRMDFSALTQLDDLQVVRNTALVSLVAAGGCLRVFSNPKLAAIVFASSMITKSVQLLDLPALTSIDFSAIGTQLRDISIVSLHALRSITGIRGRTIEKIKLVDNALLASAEDLEVDINADVNVSRNPNLGGVCRLRSPASVGTCAFDSACLFASDACLSELPGNCTRLTPMCSAGIAPSSLCALPTHTCAPPALRLTVLTPLLLARANDQSVCVSIGATAKIPRDNSSFPCNVSISTSTMTMFNGGAMTCALALGGRSATTVRSFVAKSATGGQLTLMRTSATVPTNPSSDCGMQAQFFKAGENPARISITSVIDFVDDPKLTTPTATARLTLPSGSLTGSVLADSATNSTMSSLNATATSNATSVDMISDQAPATDIGLIVGVAIGALVCAILFAVIVVCAVKRNRDSPMGRRSSARSKDMGTFSMFPSSYASNGANNNPTREPHQVYDTVPERKSTATTATTAQVVPSSYANMPMSGIVYDTVLQRPQDDDEDRIEH